MAFSMMTSADDKDVKAIGIKVDISSDILPRDTSIGTKIFMLVPNEARNVREVKSYIANFILKTPAPFQIFTGEYRILDDEDAQIFAIIQEPCRLVPVPVPRSALSSTPKRKSSDKKVTFFDGDLSTSPVQGSVGNSLDVIDHSQAGRSIHTPQEVTSKSSVKSTEAHLDEEGDLSDSSNERRKRRRRRHRSKKTKHAVKIDDDLEEEEATKSINGASSSQINERVPESPDASLPCEESRFSSSLSGNQLDVLNEETESEEETSGGGSRCKDFEFITPVTNKLNRKRVVITEIDGDNGNNDNKKKKLSDSAFESSCSFLSPNSSDNPSSSKPRQDTPIVPRALKNPRMFESARKIIDVFLNEPNGSASTKLTKKNSTEPEASVTINEESYLDLQPISSVSELNVGDHIAFKVLELDERYNPTFSEFKQGLVTTITGAQLSIVYTKNKTVVRTGKYEIDDQESVEAVKPNVVDLHFSELLEPKFVLTSATQSDLNAHEQGNQEEKCSSSPPSII